MRATFTQHLLAAVTLAIGWVATPGLMFALTIAASSIWAYRALAARTEDLNHTADREAARAACMRRHPAGKGHHMTEATQ